MGERKVVNKYYSPDFDPAKLPKNKSGNGIMDVRTMLPFTVSCNRCGSYTGRGTKYNSAKVTIRDEDYLGLRLYRFYFRCRNCCSQFILRTDPQNSGYVVETGARAATRNDKYSFSDDNDNEMKDSMEKSEIRAAKLKREMVDEADLELIKCVNKRQARVCDVTDRALKRLKESSSCGDGDVLNEEDEELVRSIFRRKERKYCCKIQDEDLDDGTWGRKSKKIVKGSGSFLKSKKMSVGKVSIVPKERPAARESRNTNVALQSLCQNYADEGDD